MPSNNIPIIIGIAATTALVWVASAQAWTAAEPQTAQSLDGTDVSELHVEGFLGTLVFDERARGEGISVSVSDAPEGGPLTLRVSGNQLIVENKDADIKEMYRDKPPGSKGRRWKGGDEREREFEKFLKDYPVVTVRGAGPFSLSIDDSALIVEGERDFADVIIDDIYEIYAGLGDMEKAAISISGRGEVGLGDVAKSAAIQISGSGDLELGDVAEEAKIFISGSGDVMMGSVGDDLTLRVSGSGDVDMEGVGGSAEVVISGSGDLEADDIGDGLKLSVNGSGDIAAGDINGKVDIKINGSGDVSVDGGRFEQLRLSISGSGDVDMGGVAINPMINISGSGDVTIDDYEGNVSVQGDGDVRVGDLKFPQKR